MQGTVRALAGSGSLSECGRLLQWRRSERELGHMEEDWTMRLVDQSAPMDRRRVGHYWLVLLLGGCCVGASESG